MTNIAQYALKTTSNGRRGDVVTVRGLVKIIGRARVLDGVDLTVRRGEMHMVLGPAASGKTVLIETLLGGLHPDAGEVSVLGVDPTRATAAWHRRLASVYGEPHIWADLTGSELISNSAQMHGGIDLVVRNELLELFDLDPTKHGHNYTPNERRRIMLTAALASAVELVILDEPTDGLNPRMRREFIGWLRGHRRRHRGMLLTGRDLADAEMVADRISVLDRGHTTLCATVADLRRMTRTTIVAELDQPDPTIAEMPSVHELTISGDTVYCLADTHAVPDVVRRFLDCGMRHLSTTAPTLDQLVDAFADKTASAPSPMGPARKSAQK
jgi:ABC-2 type transport system ATP-binding protein